MDAYATFVARLAATLAPSHTSNLYNGDGAAVRRDNLAHYLRLMAARRPWALLVGEAPGYRGCGVTGVPFTSAAVLLAEPSPFGLFGAAAGFDVSGNGEGPQREATATVVWETLTALHFLPLLWNACPFHPHPPGRPAANRAPATADLAAGRAALEALLGLFAIERVLAVGNVAAAALERWRIVAARARHPGHGGKAQFGCDVTAFLAG